MSAAKDKIQLVIDEVIGKFDEDTKGELMHVSRNFTVIGVNGRKMLVTVAARDVDYGVEGAQKDQEGENGDGGAVGGGDKAELLYEPCRHQHVEVLEGAGAEFCVDCGMELGPRGTEIGRSE